MIFIYRNENNIYIRLMWVWVYKFLIVCIYNKLFFKENWFVCLYWGFIYELYMWNCKFKFFLGIKVNWLSYVVEEKVIWVKIFL